MGRLDLSGFAPPEAGGSGLSGETPIIMRGRVVSAPESFADTLQVAALVSAEEWPVPAAQWTTRDNALPAANDVCAISVDDRGDAWVNVARPSGPPQAIPPLVWHGLPYNATNWTDLGLGFQVGQYALDVLGLVHVRGVIKSVAGYTFATASTLTIATLPVGFRPGAQEIFDGLQEDSAADRSLERIDVAVNGQILLNGGSGGALDVLSTGAGNNGNASYLSLKRMIFEQVN